MKIIDLWQKSAEKRKELEKLQRKAQASYDTGNGVEHQIEKLIIEVFDNITSRRKTTDINLYGNSKLVLRPDGLGESFGNSQSSKLEDLKDFKRALDKKNLKKLFKYIKRKKNRRKIILVSNNIAKLREAKPIKLNKGKGKKVEITEEGSIFLNDRDINIEEIEEYMLVEQTYSVVKRLLNRRVERNKRQLELKQGVLDNLRKDLSPYLILKKLENG